MALKWRHPFTAVVAGPTGCGKTQFVLKLIKNAATVMTPPPSRIVYCYGSWQGAFDNLWNVEFNEGLPDKSHLREGTLMIIDDLMSEADQRVTDIFTKHSHHAGVSVLFLTQNFFNKNMRIITLNCHYLILFKSPRDVSQIQHLARQMYPGKVRFLIDVFKNATFEPFGYLAVDLKPDTPDEFRLRTQIFPGEGNFVYLVR